LFQGLIAGIIIAVVVSLGEGFSWPGLLLKELSYLGFWQSSFIIGFIWRRWHVPLILLRHNYP